MKALSFNNVSKEYSVGHGVVRALDGISFDIESEKVTVILGPSGSGKSTMLNLIGGMDKLTSGQLMVFGENISQYSERELTKYRRNRIGFVFQFYNLIPSLNAYENVAIVQKMNGNSFCAKEMIRNVGLENRLKHFPSELSGGELQRLSIARALCKNPDILLCDEPTGALDSETGRMVLELLTDMAKKYKKTVVIVTHNASIALCADTVVHLKDGHIEEVVKNEKPLSVDEVDW
ncbi:putative ABC transport system ATP-binding protein [Pseudobutyrivibrio sp. NOR37]|uniref:ABC transporter ATP-binding protein n=2 Tax=Pseudobutyrivibrio TaxID=46205 RepID=A0A2G3DRU4_9FIRM|nr:MULTISPECIES: ABC transporter ATP-binding protein [Pseudobutyrivibrio]NEX01822.1 ABC transporter ATP-binding protein [Pseudobutyrivibrio xylanivorans]PHU33752.1 ABC transporter ATP-binding protein [Pseudobutyrivibrio ruminis]PHU40893.1 ABC transporter ATP-binding protein [Pseudobutyrivibrio ruminis]SFR71999.1 putative ABC transport system ATP-binding protein [Pseudobutyrivibrio sp. NOR37]